jgi:hypothetical protein
MAPVRCAPKGKSGLRDSNVSIATGTTSKACLSQERVLFDATKRASISAFGSVLGDSANTTLQVEHWTLPPKGPQSGLGMEHLDAASRCESDHGPSGADGDKALRIAALGTATRNGAAIGENAPRRTRTFDPLIKSQLLYQLS